ncbi:monocarboxylate transporter 14-like [Saccoglossus kowalevskii]|uniref:Monocarboxylate transporter 14-like n=1 Tax=Saccoglossus kowalevskii TaxID=10224 RepID=A0ABM0MRZ2_SACKO|nr:PREDICTED: monocarboxylate transporter 14-like [Saccoglossus kowalevskii]
MSYGIYVIYPTLLGLLSGMFFTLFSQVIKDITGGPNVTAGVALGTMAIGVGALIGPTVAGVIYDTSRDYQFSFYFFGSCMVFAGLIMLTLEPYATLRQHKLQRHEENNLAFPEGDLHSRTIGVYRDVVA